MSKPTFYVSEATNFLTELKAARPNIAADQKNGRALLWDKPPRPLAEQAELRAPRVPQKPYVYATSTGGH